MRYYKLSIDTNNNSEIYNMITKILELQPTENKRNKISGKRCYTWNYFVIETDRDPYFDFINNFLDILEPKFDTLEGIGITRDKIILLMLYEYKQQCGIEFNPEEMLRLGKSGIHLNIDCWQND